jgi:hypothetical protein
VDVATGRPLGRVPLAEARPLRGLTVTAGGDVVLLDAAGATVVVGDEAALAGPLGALQAGAGVPLSAVAAVAGLPGSVPAVGDEAGAVYWYRGGELLGQPLHAGPVTALAAAVGAVHNGVPVLVSGGFDGTVRVWVPGSEPLVEDSRPPEVTAVAMAAASAGMTVAAAWADGLVRVHRPGHAAPLELRLGSAVWSLALDRGLLVLGTSDGVAAVRL